MSSEVRLVTCILKKSVTLSCEPSIYSKGMKSRDDDGSDVHRISSKDLENIYNEVRHDVRTELFFLLMLTTGLRVGGLVKMQIKHIAVDTNGVYELKAQGRTVEKGNKWVTFMLSTDVRTRLTHWLNHGRPTSTSTYVFPGKNGGHIATDTVRKAFAKICKKSWAEWTSIPSACVATYICAPVAGDRKFCRYCLQINEPARQSNFI